LLLFIFCIVATDADAAPGQVQEGWLYHDDHC